MVCDLNGLGRVGYLVRYVPTVHADPSDQPIRVAGGAALQVTIQAPDFRGSGNQPWRTPWQLGQRLVGAQTTLREVRMRGQAAGVPTIPSHRSVTPQLKGHVRLYAPFRRSLRRPREAISQVSAAGFTLRASTGSELLTFTVP